MQMHSWLYFFSILPYPYNCVSHADSVQLFKFKDDAASEGLLSKNKVVPQEWSWHVADNLEVEYLWSNLNKSNTSHPAPVRKGQSFHV